MIRRIAFTIFFVLGISVQGFADDLPEIELLEDGVRVGDIKVCHLEDLDLDTLKLNPPIGKHFVVLHYHSGMTIADEVCQRQLYDVVEHQEKKSLTRVAYFLFEEKPKECQTNEFSPEEFEKKFSFEVSTEG